MSEVHGPAPSPSALPHARPRHQSGLTGMSPHGLDCSASVSTLRGTEGSNPPSSRRESTANLTAEDVPLQQIAADAAAGRLDVKPTRIFRFEEIRKAHRVMEANE